MGQFTFSRRRAIGVMTAAASTAVAPHAGAQTPAPAASAGQAGGPGRGGPDLPFELISMDPAFNRIIAPGTPLEPIANVPDVNWEGPVWRQGALWVSDQANGGIYAIMPDGQWRVVLAMAGGPIDHARKYNQGPNAELPYKDGALIFCRQSLRDIAIMDKTGKVSPFLTTFDGKRFNAPNDMVFARDGALWFTDPPFSLPGWRDMKPGDPQPAAREIPFNGVFRYKDGKVTAAVTDLITPNGLGFSPDGKTFYVNNTAPDPLVRAYDVGADGALSNMRVLVSLSGKADWGRGYPDGLKVDAAGNVWTTGPGGIVVIAPSGTVVGRLQMPTGATNMAWGEDYKSLFLVGGTRVYRIRTLVKGQVPLYAQP